MNERRKLLFPNLVSNNPHPAIYEKGQIITYGELWRGVDNLSENILKTGVMPGNRIGLCFDNSAPFVYGFLAILGASCLPVLLSPNLPAEKIAYVLNDSDASGMLSDVKMLHGIKPYPTRIQFAFLEGISEPSTAGQTAMYSFSEAARSKEVCIDRRADESRESEALPSNVLEIASIIYTSGTTGKPKGVMLTETNLSLATSAIVQHLGLTSLDTCLVTMSFAHCAGLLHLLAHLRVGAKLVTGENPAFIGPFLAAIRKYGVTVLPGVPSLYTLLLKHPKHKVGSYLRNIRAVESSSAMINSSLIKEIVDLFPSATLFNTYGLTEAPRATYMVVTPSDQDSNLSVGLPTAGVRIQIVNEQLQRCRPYEEGEIIIDGPNLALGYWNNPEKTAAAFNSAGFRTGDIGYLDKNGFLYLKGRKDDMIKIGAEAVYPHEIEEVIASYPGIVDVLAYGVEDEIQGYAVHIKAVRKNKNIEGKAILEYCRDKLEKHKIPSQITFCDSIILEESGKPKRAKALS